MLFNGELTDRSNFFSYDYLRVNSCDFQQRRNALGVQRLHGRKDFHFLYIINGCCVAMVNGSIKSLFPGDFLIYRPKELQQYDFVGDESADSYYCHFSGTIAEELMRRSGLLDKSLLHIEPDEEFLLLWRELVRQRMTGLSFWEMGSNGVLLQIFAYLARFVKKSAGMQEVSSRELISEVINTMQNDYRSNIPIEEYARRCSLSKSRFLHIFRATVGISPLQYVLRVRMEHAKYYLIETSWPIAQIAAEVGFHDALYFSRSFRKIEGCSPTEYRVRKMRAVIRKQ